jgi:hypothetical protein
MHYEEEKMMTEVISASRVQQWGGAAFVLGNLLFMVNKLNEMSRLFLGRWMLDVISGQNPVLIFLGQVALVIGYVAYYQFYSQRLGGRAKMRSDCSVAAVWYWHLGMLLSCPLWWIFYPMLRIYFCL